MYVQNYRIIEWTAEENERFERGRSEMTPEPPSEPRPIQLFLLGFGPNIFFRVFGIVGRW